MPRSAGERPLSADTDEHRQEHQAELIEETGNEATEPDEEQVLHELYGEPSGDGVYRKLVPHDG